MNSLADGIDKVMPAGLGRRGVIEYVVTIMSHLIVTDDGQALSMAKLIEAHNATYLHGGGNNGRGDPSA